MKSWSRVLKAIDYCSACSGRLVGWLIVLLAAAVLYEVIARYVFGAPTAWSFDISYMLGGTAYITGGAYVLYLGRHTRVDIIHKKLSHRTQLIIDLVFTATVFFPLFVFLFSYSIQQAYQSWVVREVSSRGVTWQPILYPFRAVLPLGIGLLLLQGVATFSRDLVSLFKGGNEK